MKACHFSFSCHFKVVSSKVLVHHKARDQIFNLLQIKSFIVIAKLMKVPGKQVENMNCSETKLIK